MADMVTVECAGFLQSSLKSDVKYLASHEPIALEKVPSAFVSTRTLCTQVLQSNSLLTAPKSDGFPLISSEQVATIPLILNAQLGNQLFEIGDCNNETCTEDDFEPHLEVMDGIGILQAETNIGLSDFNVDTIRVSDKIHRCIGRVGKLFRRGFWLADGYGFGKTRILAGLAVEHHFRHGRQVLYICESRESISIFLNELLKFGFTSVVCCDLENPEPLTFLDRTKTQVLFVTYSELDSDVYFKDVFSWLGPNSQCLMIFDEFNDLCYRKNDHRQKQQRVIDRLNLVQEAHPLSRVVFACPETSIDIVENFQLLWRLGLYGKNLSFSNAKRLYVEISKRGDFGRAQLLMELKMKGLMISRYLSHQNVQVKIATATRNLEFDILYDRSVHIWKCLRDYLVGIVTLVWETDVSLETKNAVVNDLCNMFFGNRKKFFDRLSLYPKLGELEYATKQAIAHGMTVIVGIKDNDIEEMEYFQANGSILHGLAFSPTMMILRNVMVKFGIPVGYPKLYFKNGSVSFVNNLEYDADDHLIALERMDSKLRDMVGKPQLALQSCQEDKHPDVSLWLPYSVGASMTHPQLNSPESLCWDVLPKNSPVSTNQLVRWYHQLAVLLPVSTLDEINARLGTNNITGSEITGRILGYQWNVLQQCWTQEEIAHAEHEYYRFQKGESSVVLVGHDHAKDLLLHCDYTSENQRQRLHILLDFTLTKEDIIRQCSRTHRCGQKQEPVYYMISSDLPSDKKLVYDMAKYFADLGACIQIDEAVRSDSLTLSDEIFLENGNNAIYSAAVSLSMKPEFEEWIRVVPPKLMLMAGTTVNTNHLKLRTNTFLERLRCLPIKVQQRIMDVVEMEMVLNRSVENIQGTFREVPTSYKVNVSKRICFRLGMEHCEMLLIELSRFNTSSNLIQILSKERCKFYTDEDDNSIFAAFMKEGQTLAVFPHSKELVVLPPAWRNNANIREKEYGKGKKLWIDQLRHIRKQKKLCGHERNGASTRCPLTRRTDENLSDFVSKNNNNNNKCLHRWGSYRFVMLTGCFLSLLEHLDVYDLPMQHCKAVTYCTVEKPATNVICEMDSSVTHVGLYIGGENFSQSALDVFNRISEIAVNAAAADDDK